MYIIDFLMRGKRMLVVSRATMSEILTFLEEKFDIINKDDKFYLKGREIEITVIKVAKGEIYVL